MPWKSVQQARWGHSPAGLSALGGKAKVAEWDAATPKGSLPARAKGTHMNISNILAKHIKRVAAKRNMTSNDSAEERAEMSKSKRIIMRPSNKGAKR